MCGANRFLPPEGGSVVVGIVCTFTGFIAFIFIDRFSAVVTAAVAVVVTATVAVVVTAVVAVTVVVVTAVVVTAVIITKP